jgi:ATP-dependent RNA helicase DeaD
VWKKPRDEAQRLKLRIASIKAFRHFLTKKRPQARLLGKFLEVFLQQSLDQLGKSLKELVETMKLDANIVELDQYRKVFRQNVPFWLRSYFAAFLIRHLNREGRLDQLAKQTTAPQKDRSTSRETLNEPTTLFFGAGRSRRTNRQEIIQILTEKAGVDAKDVGEIKIKENYSFIDVEKKVANSIIEKLDGYALRGRPVKVNFAIKK